VPTFWIKNEYRSINWFRRQITFKSFMYRHSVDVCVINKPNYLVAKQL